MSARLAARFAALAARNQAGLVAFLMAGDPDPATALACMDAAITAGADVLEIGVPFTDPSADGPSIQRAAERALKSKAGLPTALAAAKALRAKHPETPLVLMGYANPIERMGPQRFAVALREAGADGAIVVDLPPEEDEELRTALENEGLCLIRLATPTTSPQRLHQVVSGASGFLYYVAVAGVTGGQSATPEAAERALAALKQATALPIALGFGVRSPAAAAAFARFADAVVVGSALVDAVGEAAAGEAPGRVGETVRQLAGAVHAARAPGEDDDGR